MTKINLVDLALLIILLIIVGVFYYYAKFAPYYLARYLLFQGKKLSYWYSLAYTIIVVGFGIYVILKYRHSSYIALRTISLMVIRLSVSFLFIYFIIDWTAYQLIYVWPLELQPLVWNISPPSWLPNARFFRIYGIVASFAVLPVITWFYGKRVFCGWICGCGALAETLGDPFRKKAPKTRFAYKLEYAKYVILLAAVIVTFVMILTEGFLVDPNTPNFSIYYLVYWFIVLFLLAGVVGLGTYHIFGGRVWCRFFCPMAAYLSIFSFLGRYEIVTQKQKCTGCGKCTANCQMGIDIHSRAKIGLPVRGRECVGCGICIAGCPKNALEFANRFQNL